MRADYLEVGGAYEFLGTGFTALNEEPNAQTTTKRYINDAASTKRVTGYEAVNPFTSDYIKSEAAIAFMADIAEMRRTGADTETDYVRVDLDDPTGTPGEFAARKVRVSVEVSSISDTDGEYTLEGNLNEIGDVVAGTFDTAAKSFTPTVVVGP
ncbi:MAG: hypothetical protein LBD12_01975 [Clostridiales Family XIII bacterium]|jgi:hypothetical protein|nr:hypothetical protein [Clostridiales Family XIII bacterium]